VLALSKWLSRCSVTVLSRHLASCPGVGRTGRRGLAQGGTRERGLRRRHRDLLRLRRNLRIPTSSDIESGSLGSPRERQVNEYDNGICSQTERLKTKDKRQKTAPGNCLIYPSFIHSFIHSLRLHLAPSKRHFPSTVSPTTALTASPTSASHMIYSPRQRD